MLVHQRVSEEKLKNQFVIELDDGKMLTGKFTYIFDGKNNHGFPV